MPYDANRSRSTPSRAQGTHHDRPLGWGKTREMNAIEAMMWRGEADPRMRSTITSFGVLDCAPEWDRFVDACEWATRMAPRFRQKVVEPSFGLGTPRWVTDPDFDLHYHVRRIRVGGDATWRDAFESAEQFAMTPFDRARSPWEVLLIEGLPHGEAAIVIKLHHSTTDGMGATQLFSELYSSQREHNPNKPQPAAPSPEWVRPADLLRQQMREDAASGAAGIFKGAEGLFDLLRDPVSRVKEARELVESAGRVMSDGSVEGSPLLEERSMKWRFLALDIRFADLRAAAKSVGGTLNDAFVASLLGAFRLYHAKFGMEIESIPMAIPISIRKEGDPEGGNQFTGARFAGPVAIPDPAERIREIGEIVRNVRAEPAMDAMGLIAPIISRLPAAALGALSGQLTASNDLQASNVPGFREDFYVAGAKLERVYGFGPLPGCATMISLVSHGPLCCVGVNVDRAAVTDPEFFAQCLIDGFGEVLALAEDSEPPVRRV